jgi:hypothetical protein
LEHDMAALMMSVEKVGAGGRCTCLTQHQLLLSCVCCLLYLFNAVQLMLLSAPCRMCMTACLRGSRRGSMLCCLRCCAS